MQTSTATALQKLASSLPSGIVAALGAATFLSAAVAGEWSGEAGVELRGFITSEPSHPDRSVSLYLQPEYFHDSADGRSRLVFTPFLRLDETDAERSHADLRELYWRRSFDNAELVVGLRRVFWGVTESAHLVDVINQTDQVENLDGEDKLGQPMLSLSLIRDWGTTELFVLPYFRERTFGGANARLSSPLYVDESAARFESGAGRHHADAALRWSHYFGAWDIGIAHFAGTSREPVLVPGIAAGMPVLVPVYDQIQQTSIDLQATLGDWLLKFEGYNRAGQGKSFQAYAAGLEYTLVGLLGTPADLGLIGEYLYDNRVRGQSLFDDDVAIGFRLALNDTQSTELLAFMGIDTANQERFTSIEGSRRIGQSWRLTLEGRFFSSKLAASPLSGIDDDDYIALGLQKFY